MECVRAAGSSGRDFMSAYWLNSKSPAIVLDRVHASRCRAEMHTIQQMRCRAEMIYTHLYVNCINCCMTPSVQLKFPSGT